jgi:hypothetical protein
MKTEGDDSPSVCSNYWPDSQSDSSSVYGAITSCSSVYGTYDPIHVEDILGVNDPWLDLEMCTYVPVHCESETASSEIWSLLIAVLF